DLLDDSSDMDAHARRPLRRCRGPESLAKGDAGATSTVAGTWRSKQLKVLGTFNGRVVRTERSSGGLSFSLHFVLRKGDRCHLSVPANNRSEANLDAVLPGEVSVNQQL